MRYMSKISWELDYDWKDSKGRGTSGRVVLDPNMDDVEAKALLVAHDKDIASDFGNKAISFIPEVINGFVADIGGRQLGWVAGACLCHLKQHPKTRKFDMTGTME